MKLNNCEKCGRIFIKKSDNLCPACIKNRFVEIKQIKGWIAASNIPHLSNIEDEIGVSVKNFKEYLWEERIKTHDRVIGNCEVCGREINIKKRRVACNICMDKLIKSDGGIHSHFYSKKDD